MTAPVQQRRPFLQNSIIWEKKGPLPVWGWAALVLVLALAYAWWKRKRADGQANQTATGFKDELPGDQSAPAIFLLPVNSPSQTSGYNGRRPTPNDMPRRKPPARPDATVPTAPPGGGSAPPTTPPQTPVVVVPEFVTAPAMTNLYDWSQDQERAYGITTPVIEKAKATGKVRWGGPMGSGPWGNTPYFADPTQVRLR